MIGDGSQGLDEQAKACSTLFISCYDINVIADLSPTEYRALAEFRYQIRRFLQFSAEAAREHGLEPQQHQLLLALKGLPDEVRPTIRELAERLQIQHHSAVELVDRLVERDVIRREHAGADRREVLLRLTRHGAALLRRLSLAHHNELEKTGPILVKSLTTAIRRGKRAA
jgi:DNA-binding MarR family transcriptional regulator